MTAYLRIGDRISAFIPRSTMRAKGWPTRTIEGTIRALTMKGILLDVQLSGDEADSCRRCGLDISRDGSRLIGYGPDCARHMGLHWPRKGDISDAELEVMRAKIRTAIVGEHWVPRRYSKIKLIESARVQAAVAQPVPVQATPAFSAPPARPIQVRITSSPISFIVEAPYSTGQYLRTLRGATWAASYKRSDGRRGAWMLPRTPIVAQFIDTATQGLERRADQAFLAALKAPISQAS